MMKALHSNDDVDWKLNTNLIGKQNQKIWVSGNKIATLLLKAHKFKLNEHSNNTYV